MGQECVIVRFPGTPATVQARYAEGLRRFAEAHPSVRPTTLFIGQSHEHPDALVVVILWPDGVGHEALGKFLLPHLKELGLERPAIDHITVSKVGFDAVAALR